MTSWSELDRLRKILVIILVVSTVLGVAAFAVLGRQEGVVYEGCFLRVSTDTSAGRWNTVYSGKVDGEPISFTVTPERKVIYRKGESSAVSYTIVEDSTAAPEDGFAQKGIEVRQGETVVFRGAYADFGDSLWFVNEAGNSRDLSPVLETAVEVACAPQLTHRGNLEMLAYGLLCTVFGLVQIFFAEALFQLHLAFRIRDPYGVEPSQWELFSRAAGQVAFTVLAVVCYIVCFVY